jgi:uncharacterized membrane protein
LWALVLLAAFTGLAFTTIQIMEKIAILQDPFTRLACDVNSTLSCSNVLTAWQSSVLGPPNSFIGAAMFAILGSAALAGLLASTLSRAYLTTIWGLAVFFLAFASWFMYETAFDIGALCLWCIGVTTAVVVLCATLTRLADRGNAFGQTRFGLAVAAAVRRQLDLAVWGGWWLAIAAMLWIGLGT